MTPVRLFFVCLASLVVAASARADVTDTPHFKVDGVVIVWSAEGDKIQAQTPTANIGRSVRLETAAQPLVTSNLVGLSHTRPETLVPLNAPAEGQTSFFVASNTAFNIEADIVGAAQLSARQLANIAFRMTIERQGSGPVAFGQKAQFPHSGGATGGLAPNIETLADLHENRTLFTGDQRTARSSGSIVEQSVRFTAFYSSKTAVESTQLPSVTYTIFAP